MDSEEPSFLLHCYLNGWERMLSNVVAVSKPKDTFGLAVRDSLLNPNDGGIHVTEDGCQPD